MYREAVITFIDILGFKELIASDNYDNVEKKLKVVHRLSGVNEQNENDGEGFESRVIQFSDSIIRIRPLDSTANKKFRYGLMFHEMLDLVHLQGELINNDVCIRGGVSIGLVHFDNETLFGPGFIRAYEMESAYANYPRIALDPNLIEQLQKDQRLASGHNLLADEFDHIQKNIRKGSDGIYFINYLRSFLGEIDDAENVPAFLAHHKEIILRNASAFQGLNPVSAKYLWMATYHNEVIADLPNPFFESHGLKRGQLEISSKEMPILQNVPQG